MKTLSKVNMPDPRNKGGRIIGYRVEIEDGDDGLIDALFALPAAPDWPKASVSQRTGDANG